MLSNSISCKLLSTLSPSALGKWYTSFLHSDVIIEWHFEISLKQNCTERIKSTLDSKLSDASVLNYLEKQSLIENIFSRVIMIYIYKYVYISFMLIVC